MVTKKPRKEEDSVYEQNLQKDSWLLRIRGKLLSIKGEKPKRQSFVKGDSLAEKKGFTTRLRKT